MIVRPDQLQEPLAVAEFMAIDGENQPMHLADDLGYVEDGEVTGVCTVGGTFPVRLRLDELVR